jgi:hypothetical protein
MLESLADGLLNYKRLEQIGGFLGHISMTYPVVTPYFKGLHLTLASHHPGGGAGSWKMALKEWAFYLQEAVELGKLSEAEALSMTQAALEPTEPEP